MNDTTSGRGSAAKLPGVVLAGGRSRRMGVDKAGVLLCGLPLLDRVVARLAPQTASVAVNSNAPQTGHASFPDTLADYPGPLAGILAAMRQARVQTPDARHVATVPTDTPFFPHDLVARLQGSLKGDEDIAVAVSGDDMHPVFGLWPVSLADDLETFLLTDDKRRVRSFIARHPMQSVDFPHVATREGLIDPFFNINTPADLERAEHWLVLLEEERR